MPDKNSLDVNRVWQDIREYADKVWNPEVARGVMSLFVGADNFNPVGSQTYYFGSMVGKPPKTTEGMSKIYVPSNVKITKAYINWYVASTNSTDEGVSMYIRTNGDTDHLIMTLGTTDDDRLFYNNNLDVILLEGEYFEIKIVTPEWVVNPVAVYVGGNLFGWAA